MRITNTGSAGIQLPVSPDINAVVPSPDILPVEFQRTLIYLESAHFSSTGPVGILYGSLQNGATLFDLQPGHSVTLRLKMSVALRPHVRSAVRREAVHAVLAIERTRVEHIDGKIVQTDFSYGPRISSGNQVDVREAPGPSK